jgi:hypothetical protein
VSTLDPVGIEGHSSDTPTPGGARAGVIAPGILITTHLWITWLQVYFEQEGIARSARAAVENAPEGSQYGEHLSREMNAAMIAVTGAAAALDSFYGEARPKINLPPNLRAKWATEGPKTAMQILETLKLGFDLGANGNRWVEPLRELYDLRDPALHHRAKSGPPARHPSGRSDTSKEMADYTVESGTKSVDLAMEVITFALAHPRPALEAWAGGMADVPSDLAAQRASARP